MTNRGEAARQLIFQAVFESPSLTASQIAVVTGLDVATTNSVCRDLASRGVFHSAGWFTRRYRLAVRDMTSPRLPATPGQEAVAEPTRRYAADGVSQSQGGAVKWREGARDSPAWKLPAGWLEAAASARRGVAQKPMVLELYPSSIRRRVARYVSKSQ